MKRQSTQDVSVTFFGCWKMYILSIHCIGPYAYCIATSKLAMRYMFIYLGVNVKDHVAVQDQLENYF